MLSEICVRGIREKFVYKQSKTIEYVENFLRNLQISRADNSRILRIENAEFSEYCFYMNTNIQGDFQVSISVPLRPLDSIAEELHCGYSTGFEMQLCPKTYYNSKKVQRGIFNHWGHTKES